MNRLRRLFFIDCSEANSNCDKAQYDDAKPLERARLFIHLAFCKACRKYTFRNRKLSRLLKKAHLKPCPEEQKKAWKKQIEEEEARQHT